MLKQSTLLNGSKQMTPIRGHSLLMRWKQLSKKARKEPELYSRFDGEFRKVRIGKFTYALVFRVKNEEIQIIAVMHLHRRPGYWKDHTDF